MQTCQGFAQTLIIILILGDHVISQVNKRPVGAVKACKRLLVTITACT